MDRDLAPHQAPISTAVDYDFYIDKTEVTTRAFQDCVDIGVCRAREQIEGPWMPDPKDPNYDRYPVTDVDPEQAIAYCRFRGKRLPTEAEWRLAALGTDGRKYPWGNQPPTCARVVTPSCRRASWTPVGSNPRGASPYGVLDMVGNADELVVEQAIRNRVAIYVIGPSWRDSEIFMQTYGGERTFGWPLTGFRCARAVEQKPDAQ